MLAIARLVAEIYSWQAWQAKFLSEALEQGSRIDSQAMLLHEPPTRRFMMTAPIPPAGAETPTDEIIASRRNFVAGAVTLAAAAGATEAAHAQAPKNLRYQNPPGLSAPRGYSHVVEVLGPGRTVYIAGQTAVDAGFDQVVKLNSYMTDIPSQIAILREVRSKYLKEGTLPASTAVQIVALADPRYMLEIEVVAVLPPFA
jgi:enamine deaminase RidA (YjgF/YER057c/UK114 family)